MGDFDPPPAMVTPPAQQELLSDDPRKGACRWCGRFNLPDSDDRADRFDCCDSKPPSHLPMSEMSDAARARWQACLDELDNERERFEARMAAVAASTANAAAPQP